MLNVFIISKDRKVFRKNSRINGKTQGILEKLWIWVEKLNEPVVGRYTYIVTQKVVKNTALRGLGYLAILVKRPPIKILRPLFTLQLLILPTRDPFQAQIS